MNSLFKPLTMSWLTSIRWIILFTIYKHISQLCNFLSGFIVRLIHTTYHVNSPIKCQLVRY